MSGERGAGGPAYCALAPTEDGGARLVPLAADGGRAGPVVQCADLVEAVRERPDVGRWVWPSTTDVYQRLLDAGLRVDRCYDVQEAESLLLAHEGRWGEPRSAGAAWARMQHLPVPEDPAVAALEPSAQDTLFDTGPPPLGLDALTAVYADQQRRHDAAEAAVSGTDAGRMRLLTASASAGMLVAQEMNRAGLPWSAEVHNELLDGLLGHRYPGGGEPERLAELTAQVSRAFGFPVRPDLPADVVKAFARAGIPVSSTRAWQLREIDHPAVEPLLEYKKLYRIHTAYGWGWLRTWVHEGRFHPQFRPAGAVNGRWVTEGGGALQIPKVVRRAVVADPGWRLVVADAKQMEIRVLAAISRDAALMRVTADDGDVYQTIADLLFKGERALAKISVLGAVYGQTSGDALVHMAWLRKRFPAAIAYVDTAARAGEQGRLVRSWLGRTCPPARRHEEGEGGSEPGLEGDGYSEGWAPGYSSGDARARGRFTRNFAVSASASDWALLMLAGLRRALWSMRAEPVFFQHDEVIVHCPADEARQVAQAVAEAGQEAGRIAFGDTPVRFAFSTAIVDCYADAR